MITRISIPTNATTSSTSGVMNRKETPMTDKIARIKLNSRKTLRGGDNLLRIPTKIDAKILNGCFQDFCACTACQSTSCLYSRELACASDLNCVHSSSTSIPAVSWRQPSFDFQTARRKRVFNLVPKIRTFAHEESNVVRGSLRDEVFTPKHTA